MHPSRRFAIGDIHGCAKTFLALINDIIGLKREDTLYLVGDFIDRGPDARGVLDAVMALYGEGIACAVIGNHERLFLNAVADPAAEPLWLYNGGTATLESFGVRSAADVPKKYIDFLNALPLCRVIEDYVFVHAALDFEREDPIADTQEQTMLWGRQTGVDAARLGGRTLVVGHTVTDTRALSESLDSACIRLDNGCYQAKRDGYGTLAALDLDRREILFKANCESGE